MKLKTVKKLKSVLPKLHKVSVDSLYLNKAPMLGLFGKFV